MTWSDSNPALRGFLNLVCSSYDLRWKKSTGYQIHCSSFLPMIEFKFCLFSVIPAATNQLTSPLLASRCRWCLPFSIWELNSSTSRADFFKKKSEIFWTSNGETLYPITITLTVLHLPSCFNFFSLSPCWLFLEF